MGFFSSLDTEAYDRQYTDRELVARMASYFRPYGRQLVGVFFFLLVIALAGAALPIIVSRGVDLLQSNLTALNILLLSGAVFAIGVVTWGANWMRRRLIVRMLGDIVLSLRTDAFKASAEHDLSFHDKYDSGRIVSRITSDTQDFGQTVVLITDLFSQFVQT